jgi:Tol biopolymer transport system component/DNA-binding winged helix-turn-helix (wHTH) protein
MNDSHRFAVVYEFDGFRLDPRRRSLERPDGTPVALTAKVFDALVYLVEHPGEPVGKDALTKALWPNTVVEENNLYVTISALRRALGEEASGRRHIVTLAGRGYQFVTGVRAVGAVPNEPWGSPSPRPDAAPVPAAAAPSRSPAAWLALVVVAAAALALAYGAWRPAADEQASVAAATGVGSVSQVSRLTTYPGTERSPAWSPDGNQVAFTWDGAVGSFDIYVLRLGAQTPLQLTRDPVLERSLAWSPDGNQIAFVRQLDPSRADLVVVPALGGAERKLESVRMSQRFPFSIAWTPDSKQLLFTTQIGDAGDVSRDYGLELLSLETGLVRPLPIEGEGYDTSPAFAPDGSRLAFARYDARSHDAELMVQDLGPDLDPLGEPRVVPGASHGAPRSPVWSPDGSRVLFVKDQQIFESTLDSDPRPVYAPTGEIGGFSLIWREERPVAVVSIFDDNFDIWAVALDPDTRTAIGSPVRRVHSTARDWHPRFSPDGRHIAFTSWRGGGPDVWISDADGGNPRQLSKLGAADPGIPRWSPDGAKLSFVAFAPNAEPHTYLVDIREGLPTLVTQGAATGWSRDGKYLYVTEIAGELRIYRYRRADGSRELLVDGAAAGQEAVDGQRLLYVRSNEPGIFARSLEGEVASNPEVLLVADYAYPSSHSFLPVEGGFYYVGYTPDARARALRFYNDATGAATDIAPVPAGADAVWGLAVSPDERQLLFGAPGPDADLLLLEFR